MRSPFMVFFLADGQEGVKPLNFPVFPACFSPSRFAPRWQVRPGPPRGHLKVKRPASARENKRGMLGDQDADAVRLAGWKVPHRDPSESPQRNASEGCTSSG